MPKIKTSKTFSKRIKVTASGLVKIGRIGKRHNLISAPKRRKMTALLSTLHPSNMQHIRQHMPYARTRKLVK